MAMTRCRNGHFYDDGKHSQCPYCGVQGVDLQMVSRSAGNPVQQGQPTVAKNPAAPAPAAPKAEPVTPKTQADEGKTIGMMQGEKGFDPVVGWLVCVDGPDKGKDYRLRSEKNFIGRSVKMDVAISGDESVSRESHAVVSYNPKNNGFKVLPGESRGLVYLNGEEVFAPMDMKDRDVLELGRTKLLFVALCSAEFLW